MAYWESSIGFGIGIARRECNLCPKSILFYRKKKDAGLLIVQDIYRNEKMIPT